jgi:hypothetical protein
VLLAFPTLGVIIGFGVHGPKLRDTKCGYKAKVKTRAMRSQVA